MSLIMKTFKGEIRLAGGHSLIAGHGPTLHGSNAFTEEEAKGRVASFGLFNLATPDTTTFYKDVTPEDMTPKDDDYFKPLFRGLSETIVRAAYDPIDFGHNKGVLKDSMNLILGQTVYSNHEAFVGNEKGVVSQVFWDSGYTVGGIKVPAGFNMEFLIDGKVHTKLVRDLQSKPPTVHSNSVTVQFGWQPSHPKMDINEFRGKVGTFDDKGQLIRRIVSEIYAYHETSLVAHGADPYAQILDGEGKITNPKYANIKDSFSEEKKISPFFAFDWKDSLSEKETIPKFHNTSEQQDLNDNNNEDLNMKEGLKGLVILMAALSGIQLTAEESALSEEQFAEKFDLKAFNAKVTEAKLDGVIISTLTAEVETLKGDKAILETEKTDLQTKLTAAEQFKTDNEPKLTLITEAESFKAAEIAEVQRLHGIINGKPDENMNSTFEKADVKTLTAFKKTFTKTLEDKFPSKCGKCGSTEITKASASADDEGDKGGNKGTKTLAEIREAALKNNNTDYSAMIHGSVK